MNNGLRRYGIWVVIALVGAICWGMLALSRGETVNAGWLLFAALASYAIAYRFYSVGFGIGYSMHVTPESSRAMRASMFTSLDRPTLSVANIHRKHKPSFRRSQAIPWRTTEEYERSRTPVTATSLKCVCGK